MEPILDFITDQLPAWALVPLYAVVAVGYAIARVRKVNGPIRHIINSIHEGLVTNERIQTAVKDLLSTGKLPQSFIDWVASTVSVFLVKLPEFFHLPEEAQASMVASVFSRLREDKAKQLLPTMPPDLSRIAYGRKLLVREALRAAPKIIRRSLPSSSVEL